MKISPDQPSGLTALDRPNSYIGRSVPRPNLARLTQGRGQYVSDVVLPRMAHVAFVRSPHAHARIKNIETARSEESARRGRRRHRRRACQGDHAVGRRAHASQRHQIGAAARHRRRPRLLAGRSGVRGRRPHARRSGRRLRAGHVEYEPLPAVTDAETALDPATPVIHPELGDNLTFERALTAGDPDKAFAEADAVAEATFVFGRHTGVTNEPRAIVADWNPGEERLTVYHGTQAPHMTQDIFAKHLDLESHQVRVITKDVGGSFGIKVHIYADEMATVALSKLLQAAGQIRRRPPRELRHRHPRARSSRQGARSASRTTAPSPPSRSTTSPASGRIRSIRAPAASRPTRSSIWSAGPTPARTTAPAPASCFRTRTSCASTAPSAIRSRRRSPRAWSISPRRRSAWTRRSCGGAISFADDAYPATGASGIKFEKLSHHASLDKILAMMDYAKLRAEQAELRERGIHRGIGFASFIEVTNPSAAFYGVGGARISSQDGATLRLDATGAVFVHSGVTEQGQGAESVLAQCVATSFGVPIERVRVITGDTDNMPYGGGTWASRAAGIGGEAAWQAGKALRANVLAAAASMLQADPKRSTSAPASSSTPTPAANACRSMRSRASSISAPTRCRPASRPSSW